MKNLRLFTDFKLIVRVQTDGRPPIEVHFCKEKEDLTLALPAVDTYFSMRKRMYGNDSVTAEWKVKANSPKKQAFLGDFTLTVAKMLNKEAYMVELMAQLSYDSAATKKLIGRGQYMIAPDGEHTVSETLKIK